MCLVLPCFSCASFLSFKNQPEENIPEDLHIYEKVTYPLSPFNQTIIESQINDKHFVTILNNGDDALLSRIHFIRQAQKSILIQTFIWAVDESGHFLARELIQAAQRGVKVKIIIDYITLPKEPLLFAYLTTVHPNLEIELYNPISNSIIPSKLALAKKAGLQFKGINQRMHNKVFIVDDQIAITGGRNHANDYFDRGVNRNFKDRDVLVFGPVVKQMTDSFMEYWSNSLSVSTKDMVDVQSLIKKRKDREYATYINLASADLFNGLNACEMDFSCIDQRLIDKNYDVDHVVFYADRPGKDEKIGKQKVTKSTYELGRFLLQAKESILMQTPYLVIGKKDSILFKKLAKKNSQIEISVSSNSLAAADHVHAYAFSYKNKKKYLKSFRWRIFEFKPQPQDLNAMISPINVAQRSKKYSTCVHAKTYIVDHRKVWIGSFNLDPRSASLNTEIGLIIDDETVARAVEKDIQRDMASRNSWTIGKRGELPFISHFSGLLGSIMQIIPFVDIWPFSYSGSFELKAGKQEVPFYHEDFYDHYNYVGPFPEVELTDKEIKARLIKTFLGPVEPLI